MNYIEVKNQFWRLRRSKRITNLQADLYDFLINESSSRGVGNNWENPFQCPNGLVCTAIGISEKSLIDARNVLQQLGLIEFENGVTKQKSPVYFLNDYWNKVSNPASKRGGNQGGNPVSNQGGNEGNINRNKRNEAKPNQTSKSHSGGDPPANKKNMVGEKNEYWKMFVETFATFYTSNVGNPYNFQQKDWGCLDKIYQFLKKRAEAKQYEWTEETMKNGFNFFLKTAYEKDNWTRQNFSIPNLLSQFNQIANARTTEKQATGAGVSTSSILSKIDAMPN